MPWPLSTSQLLKTVIFQLSCFQGDHCSSVLRFSIRLSVIHVDPNEACHHPHTKQGLTIHQYLQCHISEFMLSRKLRGHLRTATVLDIRQIVRPSHPSPSSLRMQSSLQPQTAQPSHSSASVAYQARSVMPINATDISPTAPKTCPW